MRNKTEEERRMRGPEGGPGGREPGEYAGAAGFGEYAAPTFDERVRTVAAAADAGILSVEAQVDELWGDSRDDAWKQSEAARILAQRNR